MKQKFLILAIFISLFGCSSNNIISMKKNDIKKYIILKNGIDTPKDNMYNIRLTCMEKEKTNANYIETHNKVLMQSIGETVLYKNSFSITEANSNELAITEEAVPTVIDNVDDTDNTITDNYVSENIVFSSEIEDHIEEEEILIENNEDIVSHNEMDYSEDNFPEDPFWGENLEFSLIEDLNGEYYASVNYTKKELKFISIDNVDSLSVISTISVNQEYYPTNKSPYKIFENEEGTDICYITVRW